MLADPYQARKRRYAGFNTTDALGTAATTTNIGPAMKSALHKIFVQRISVYVVTGNASKTLTLADNSGTIALTPALDCATGGVTFTADFGPAGRQLTVNERIKATISAAGAATSIKIEGYQKT